MALTFSNLVSVLQCENPFVDDYYFTVYNQKKEREAAGDGDADQEHPDSEDEFRQLKRDEEGPNLLLKLREGQQGKDAEYKPHQFTNSLGKLQVRITATWSRGAP